MKDKGCACYGSNAIHKCFCNPHSIKNQSAIGWFNEQVQIERSRGVISNERYNELFEKAKVMNKKQYKTTTK
jgi:hypothetical protein